MEIVTIKGKKVFKEVFVSNAQCDTKLEAEALLERIRSAHKNWTEISASVKQLPNGKWVAQREHYKECPPGYEPKLTWNTPVTY